MVMEEVMSFVMEKLKEAILLMMNFGGHVVLTLINFVGQLLLKLVNLACQGLLSLKNFGWLVLLWLQKAFGQVPLALKNFSRQVLLSVEKVFGQVALALKNFGWQILITLKKVIGQALGALENFGGQALATLKKIIGQALLAVENFGGQAVAAFGNLTGQVKKLCVQIVNWFDDVFPPETRVEKINYWFHKALPYLIIAVFLAIFIYCCYRNAELLPTVINHLKTACVGLVKMMKVLFTCCWRSKEPIMKMMKAPGRNIIIPRSSFEINPRLYFINLRAYPGDMLV